MIREIWGQGVAGDVDRIILFDGSFETAFILREFKICPQDILTDEEISAKLLLEETAHSVGWHWQSNMQVGWAAWNTPTNTRFGQFDMVKENLKIVEDLFIDFSGDADENINYYIKLEKVKISEWEGALALATNTG